MSRAYPAYLYVRVEGGLLVSSEESAETLLELFPDPEIKALLRAWTETAHCSDYTEMAGVLISRLNG